MKLSFSVLIASLFCTSAVYAQKSISYPDEYPLIDISFPRGWVVENDEGVIFANPKNTEEFFMILAPLEETEDDMKAAVAEAKEMIRDEFDHVVFDKPLNAENNGVNLLILNAKGQDEDEEQININCILIHNPADETVLFLLVASTQEAFEENGEAGATVIQSIRAHVSEDEE